MRLWQSIGVVIALSLGATVALARGEGTPKQETVTRVETRAIPYETVYEISRTVGPGRLITARKGQNGQVRRTFSVTLRGGRVVARRLVSTERRDPVSALIYLGRAGFAPSRGNFTRHKVLTMHATAYDPSAGRKRPTFRTATGRRAEFGVVAVDPRIIPLNSIVFVEGYGMAIAADTGRAIRGHRIDLCLPTRAQALQFGRRQVRVHILSRPR